MAKAYESELIHRDAARLGEPADASGRLDRHGSVGYRIEKRRHEARRKDVAGRLVVVQDHDGFVAGLLKRLCRGLSQLGNSNASGCQNVVHAGS